MPSNQDAVRLVKEFVEKVVADAISPLFKGLGDNLPASADKVGQLFIKTGSTNPGLYVSTGTTTPGWKTVTHAL